MRLFLHLWLLELQVLSILYGEVDVLQHYVNSFLVCAVKRQKSHHAVVVNLNPQTSNGFVTHADSQPDWSFTRTASLTRPQMAWVSFLNFALLMVSELSSIIEYMSGSRYLLAKTDKHKWRTSSVRLCEWRQASHDCVSLSAESSSMRWTQETAFKTYFSISFLALALSKSIFVMMLTWGISNDTMALNAAMTPEMNCSGGGRGCLASLPAHFYPLLKVTEPNFTWTRHSSSCFVVVNEVCLDKVDSHYLKRLHHELRIDQKDSTHTELPLLKVLHQLPHYREVGVKFNLTWKHKTHVTIHDTHPQSGWIKGPLPPFLSQDMSYGTY